MSIEQDFGANCKESVSNEFRVQSHPSVHEFDTLPLNSRLYLVTALLFRLKGHQYTNYWLDSLTDTFMSQGDESNAVTIKF